MTKKYVETYSSSNVAAQYPEERVNQPGYTAYHEEKSMNVVIFFTGIWKTKITSIREKESGQT